MLSLNNDIWVRPTTKKITITELAKRFWDEDAIEHCDYVNWDITDDKLDGVGEFYIGCVFHVRICDFALSTVM